MVDKQFSSDKIRDQLIKLWGNPSRFAMTPYERVEAALARKVSDRVPFDFWAVPEIQKQLIDFLNVSNIEEVLQLLGTDCRLVDPDYVGPDLETLPDGSFYSEWGSHRRVVRNEFSEYHEYASFPLAHSASVAEVESWQRWPKTEYWDWSTVPGKIAAVNQNTRYHTRYEVGGIFETAWGLYGLENFLIDLMERPEIPCAVMNCITDIYIDNVRSLMKTSQGLIDMVYTYDDIGGQNGLIMSPAMWRKYILPCHQRLNAVIKEYNLKILYHSCGAIFPLIGALIKDVGIDALNPLQPRAAGMDMQKIKDNFGEQIAFHGAIDLQETMAHGTPQDVSNEVRDRIRVLGKGGGYICTTAHYIQADSPLENVFALYMTDRSFE
jgi:uroporphyrinogen decarboxylase